MRLSIIPFLLLALIFTTASLAQDRSSQLYAYIERSDTTSLVIVDPAVNMTEEIARYVYPVSSGWSVHHVLLHELNSELWSFAVLYRGYGDVMLSIANLKTGFTRELITGAPYNPEILWSPDGQKVAFITSSLEPEKKPGLDVYIYDLTTDELKSLTDSKVRYAGLAWSSDSSEIATFSHYCEVLEYCSEQTHSVLYIFDIKTGLAIDHLILPQEFTLPCDPIFSPQEDFVAFTSHCYGYIVGWLAPSDIYLYNRQSKLVERVTTFGDKAFEGSIEKYTFYVIYGYAWLDDQTLLVGVDYRVVTKEEGHQLLTYHLDGTAMLLSSELGADFTIVPSRGQIILRSRSPEFVLNPDLENRPIQTFTAAITDLKISQDVVSKLQPITLPLTTPFVWSPDGTKAFGFVLRQGADQPEKTDEILFFDSRIQDIRVYSLPRQQEDRLIIPVGWISAEALQAPPSSP
jgi:hypothetical protein